VLNTFYRSRMKVYGPGKKKKGRTETRNPFSTGGGCSFRRHKKKRKNLTRDSKRGPEAIASWGKEKPDDEKVELARNNGLTHYRTKS